MSWFILLNWIVCSWFYDDKLYNVFCKDAHHDREAIEPHHSEGIGHSIYRSFVMLQLLSLLLASINIPLIHISEIENKWILKREHFSLKEKKKQWQQQKTEHSFSWQNIILFDKKK